MFRKEAFQVCLVRSPPAGEPPQGAREQRVPEVGYFLARSPYQWVCFPFRDGILHSSVEEDLELGQGSLLQATENDDLPSSQIEFL